MKSLTPLLFLMLTSCAVPIKEGDVPKEAKAITMSAKLPSKKCKYIEFADSSFGRSFRQSCNGKRGHELCMQKYAYEKGANYIHLLQRDHATRAVIDTGFGKSLLSQVIDNATDYSFTGNLYNCPKLDSN